MFDNRASSSDGEAGNNRTSTNDFLSLIFRVAFCCIGSKVLKKNGGYNLKDSPCVVLLPTLVFPALCLIKLKKTAKCYAASSNTLLLHNHFLKL